MKFIQKTCQVNGITMSFWDNEATSKQPIILLAHGAASGKFFEPYIKYFNHKFRLIAPDYPGRGLSDEITGENSIAQIAEYTSKLIHKLVKGKIYLVAISFGTAVANEMLQKDPHLTKKIVLIAPGEYFEKKWKIIFRIICFPARFSRLIRIIYRNIVVSISPSLFHSLPSKNLNSILKQWLAIVDYEINYTQPIKIPTQLVYLTHDGIVKKGSLTKVKKLYPLHQEKLIDTSHALTPQLFDQIIRKEISTIINFLY